MKKIFCFFLCFILLGSSCFAYTDPEIEQYRTEISETKKSLNNTKSSGDTLDPWAKGYYNVISWLFSATRGAFAYTGDALNRTKDWWSDFLGLRGETVEEFVPEHVTVQNNTYVMDVTMEEAMNRFGQYLFEEIPNKGVQYKCVDIYGKNFKYNGSSVDSTWLCEVCKKYQNDYYISLWLDQSNYSQNYYFNIKYSGGLPAIRLEPKNNGSLIKDIYYQNPNNVSAFYGLYSLTGNNGGVQGNVPYTYYTVNQDLTLQSHVASETYSMNRSLFALRIVRWNDIRVMFFDPFNMNTLEQKIPIVYQKEEYLNFYNNGVGTGTDGFCYYPSNYSNSVSTSTVNNMPTYQDCQDYSNFRDAINGNNNSVTNAEMINYITNIYPNGNDYTTNPAPPGDGSGGGGSGGGLITSLVDALGSIGTLIGSILSGLLQALLNIVGAVTGWISSLVTIFTSLIPQSFRGFMDLFYGLIPEPILNGIIALFSLACVMAVIRLIRK